MRHQLERLQRGKSTKAERRFAERLKQMRVRFKTKVIIAGREVDFVIGRYAIEINGHGQDTEKNEMLVREGYIPLHVANRDVLTTSLKYLQQHG